MEIPAWGWYGTDAIRPTLVTFPAVRSTRLEIDTELPVSVRRCTVSTMGSLTKTALAA